jgi:hypothetical protein
VHKPFYASGFICHVPTQQILLQKLDTNENPTLTFFSGKSRKGETPEQAFLRTVSEMLGYKASPSSVRPIYDYIHDTMGECFMFYIEVADTKHIPGNGKHHADWFPLAKLSKLKLSEQTRHDIVIGERVIRAALAAANPVPPVVHNH